MLQQKDFHLIDLNSRCEIKKILFGAATVIQTAFRRFLVRKSYKKLIKKKELVFTNLKDNPNKLLKFAYNYLKCSYLIDCLVIINENMYKCHTFILALNSNYFKNEIKKKSTSKDSMIRIDISFIKRIHWEIIYQYIYGVDVKINSSELKGLLEASKILEMTYLFQYCLEQQEKLEQNSEDDVKNASSSLLDSNTGKSTQTNFDKNFEILKPIKFKAKNYYYKLFLNIIDKYKEKEFSLDEVYKYLDNFIDYKKMNSKQLYQCRLIIKNDILSKCDNNDFKKLNSNLKCIYLKIINKEKTSYVLKELHISIF
jgi:hypothetical protein